jgi:hypothetical protein
MLPAAPAVRAAPAFGRHGGSGGTGGSGNIDAADQAPSMPAGCTGKFCDDFESFAAGAAPAGNWKTALARGMLAVDETRAFSGARSVRFTHQGAPANMFIELRQPVLPMAGNIVYGRLMYYLTKSPTGQYSHFEIVRGGGVLSGTSRAQLNTGAENGKVVVNYEPGDCTKYSKVRSRRRSGPATSFASTAPRTTSTCGSTASPSTTSPWLPPAAAAGATRWRWTPCTSAGSRITAPARRAVDRRRRRRGPDDPLPHRPAQQALKR